MVIDEIMPFEEQYELDEGYIRMKNGDYIPFEFCEKEIRGEWIMFAPFEEQDKLNEKMIRIKNEDYIKIDNLGEVRYSKIEESCFVATAVYGDINHPAVRILRNFRDNVLMKDEIGKNLNRLYYSGFGKKTASLIKEKTPFLMPIIRKGLDFLVDNYSNSKK